MTTNVKKNVGNLEHLHTYSSEQLAEGVKQKKTPFPYKFGHGPDNVRFYTHAKKRTLPPLWAFFCPARSGTPPMQGAAAQSRMGCQNYRGVRITPTPPEKVLAVGKKRGCRPLPTYGSREKTLKIRYELKENLYRLETHS